MTPQEAIELIESARKTMYLPKSKEYISDFGYALEMAIKALEQQPCEDAISREAVNKLKKYRFNYDTNTTIPKADIFVKITDIAELPSVTPQPKVGKWILKHRKHNSMKWLTGTDEYGVEHTVKKYEEYECDEPYCSECGKLAGDTSQNYCPNCGAKMEVEE